MEIEGTPRIIVWFAAPDVQFLNPATNILRRQFGNFDVIGMTGEQPLKITLEGKNIPFIPLTSLNGNGGGYDILLVAGGYGKLSGVLKRAKELNIDSDKILGDWIVCLPGFTFEKYRRLQRSKLSIFSLNCFGGIISNTFGLSFRSPFVNLYMKEDEYIRFLRHPRIYMAEELVFKESRYQTVLKFDYPIFTMGNVSVYMNHYPDFDEAVRKWNERKARINWYNLFVTMYTEDPEVLKKFDELPYGKKVCFVPFKSNLDSAFYINRDLKPEEQFWRIVNLSAYGDLFYYDPFDMLLYGKKTQLVDM